MEAFVMLNIKSTNLYDGKTFKLCLTKQLLNILLWCEWGY